MLATVAAPISPDPVQSEAVYSTPTKLMVLIAVGRRLVPHLIEATLIPTALFLLTMTFVGTVAAYLVALIWAYAAVGRRLISREPVPGILLLASLGISMRTAFALASGSTFVYFFQPVLGTVALGGFFLLSIAFGRPIIARFARDFCPLPPEIEARPAIVSLYRQLTYLWAAVNLVAAAATLTLLITLPLPAYVAVKPVTCWVITTTGIVLTVSASVRVAHREGLQAIVSPDGTLIARAARLSPLG
jgi:hypothetical protein